MPQKSRAETPQNSHSFGDSLQLLALVVTMISWALYPTTIFRAIAVVIGGTIMVHMVYKSHWTKKWETKLRIFVSAVCVLSLLFMAGCQLIPQWKKEHPPASPIPTSYSPSLATASSTLSIQPVTPKPESPPEAVTTAPRKFPRIVINGGAITNSHIGVQNNSDLQVVTKRLSMDHVDTGYIQNQPPQKTTYGSQTCVGGSVCAQGPGSQATYNQLGSPLPKVTATTQMQRQTGDPSKPWQTVFTLSSNVLVQTGDLRLKCSGPVLLAGISRINPASLITGTNGPNPSDSDEVVYQLGTEMLSPGRVVTVAVYSMQPVTVISGSIGPNPITF